MNQAGGDGESTSSQGADLTRLTAQYSRRAPRHVNDIDSKGRHGSNHRVSLNRHRRAWHDRHARPRCLRSSGRASCRARAPLADRADRLHPRPPHRRRRAAAFSTGRRNNRERRTPGSSSCTPSSNMRQAAAGRRVPILSRSKARQSRLTSNPSAARNSRPKR